MTETVTAQRWAQPWSYDARDRATRPELCPEFIPPPTGWQEWVDDMERLDIDQAGGETT